LTYFKHSLYNILYEKDKSLKTIAISLQKGGTGKTSLAVSLAAELAQETGAAVIVDLDPQGSASAWIGPEALEAETADVLLKEKDAKQAIIKTGLPGLFIMPTAGLDGQLKLFSETKAQQQPFCIKNLLKAIAAQGYRYCILDLSPAFGALERAAVFAADEVITPVTGDFFAVDGLQIFAANLKQLREDMDTERPIYRKIIFNAIDNRIPQHKENLATVKKAETLDIFTIPVDPAFRKAQASGLTIQELKGTKPETIAELNRLAKSIIQEG
jgi:chromosome partitioning protein